ncbi:MAG: OsmC family protein [Cyclobacteriaceae bacterium]
MEHLVLTNWTGEMSFRSDADDYEIIMDASGDAGGEYRGPTPGHLLLASVSGCTGMDIISLLQKMRVKIAKMEISVTGEITTEHPKHYSAIHLKYEFSGKKLRREKIKNAVMLAHNEYCGVSNMLSPKIRVSYEIAYIEEPSESLLEM